MAKNKNFQGKKPLKPNIPVQFRVENYGPYSGRTQSFQRYTVGPNAKDALIKRSS